MIPVFKNLNRIYLNSRGENSAHPLKGRLKKLEGLKWISSLMFAEGEDYETFDNHPRLKYYEMVEMWKPTCFRRK